MSPLKNRQAGFITYPTWVYWFWGIVVLSMILLVVGNLSDIKVLTLPFTIISPFVVLLLLIGFFIYVAESIKKFLNRFVYSKTRIIYEEGKQPVKIRIREEAEDDPQYIRAIHIEAFGQTNEGNLVDELRSDKAVTASLVAELKGRLIGHILFSLMTINRDDKTERIAGIGPMAVRPPHQKKGVGTHLVKEGIAECRRQRIELVCVLGHPEFYARFGFEPAHQYNLSCEFEAPPEVFRVLFLKDSARSKYQGRLHYHPEFKKV